MPVGAASTSSSVGRRRRLSSARSDGAPASTPSAPATASIPSVQEAEALFQTLTVAEMKEKRKEFNGGVEAKRHDLRMLVGKRYAGLIEVADGIAEMKTSAEGVTSSVSDLQSLCRQLKKQHASKPNTKDVVEVKTPSDSAKQFYSITGQIKLLIGLPGRISDALAAKNCTRASLLLLLGTHVHQGLRLDTTAPDATQVLPFFPVISRIWPSIARFRPVIAAAARAQLTSSALSPAAANDALTAIVALEGVTLRQVFADFLIARSEALNRVFASSEASVKDELTEGISILLLSLKLVHQLFSPSLTDQDASTSLLTRLGILTSTSSVEVASDVAACCGTAVAAALPPAVVDFKPTLRGKVAPLGEDQLRERCLRWFEVSLSSLRASLSTQLAYVSSVKGLAHVRDVTIDVLAKPEISNDWQRVSTAVLGRDVCVWKEAVRPLVLNRLEALLQQRLWASVDGLIEDLKAHDNSAGGSDVDVLAFMWSESSSDIPRIAFGEAASASAADPRKRGGNLSTSTWKAASASSSPGEASESQLKMKTKGRTPFVQTVCRKLDDQLQIFLEDARHFAVLKDVAISASTSVDLGEDVSFISSALTRFCYEAWQRFFAFFDEELETTAKKLGVDDENDGENKNPSARPAPSESTPATTSTPVIAARLLFFGRVCEALTDQAPRLFNALVPSAALAFEDAGNNVNNSAASFLSSSSTRSSLSIRRSMLSSASRPSMTSSATATTQHHHQDQSLFVDVKEDLLKRFWSAWDVWRRASVNDALERLRRTLGGSGNGGNGAPTTATTLLTSGRLTVWETVEIKDEEEAGKDADGVSHDAASVASTPLSSTSSFRVPAHASVGLHGVLKFLCRRVNDAGGYAVPKSVVDALAEDFLRGAAGEFARLLDDDDDDDDDGKETDTAGENATTKTTTTASKINNNNSNIIPLNQTLATQLSFDARFMLQLLSSSRNHRGVRSTMTTTEETPSSSTSSRQKMESFLSRLESFIDPFDLDLLQPHLRARVQRHAQRTAALYGLLTENNNNNASRGTGGVGGIIGGGTGVEKASTLLLCGGSSTLGSRFPTIPLSMPGGGAGGGKDGTALRRLPGVGSDAANSSAARRKEEEAKGGVGAASPMHKAATWSAGLSKLTSAREGSNSPSDFFKSGAALYVSWFGGGGGGGGGGGNSE